MDFWRAILGLVRRKYVGLPVIAVSVAAAGLAFFLVPTHYLSSAFMVLATPPTGGTLSQDPSRPTGLTNPLLQFNESLRTTASILIHSMNTPEVAIALGASKNGPTMVTINDGSTNPHLLGTNGPFVYVEGDSTSAAESHAVVVRAQQRVRDELADRQKALGAPQSTFIAVVDVVSPSTPEAQLGDKWQAAGVTLVLGVILGLGGAYVANRVLAAQRSRRSAESRSTEKSAEAAGGSDDPGSAQPSDTGGTEPVSPPRAQPSTGQVPVMPTPAPEPVKGPAVAGCPVNGVAPEPTGRRSPMSGD